MNTQLAPSLLITGTGTEVGKTFVAVGLVRAWRALGMKTDIYKPFETGSLSARDTTIYERELGCPVAGFTRCTQAWEHPVAPAVASQLSGKRPDLLQAHCDFQHNQQLVDWLFVEGAGGLAVPISEQITYAQLAWDWDLPVIIVARGDLGTIHHTVTSVEYALARGLEVLGIVINHVTPPVDAVCARTNPEQIQRLVPRVPVLGVVDHAQHSDTAWATLARTIYQAWTRSQHQEDVLQLDKQFCWHPFTQMRDWVAEDQLVITKAHGNELIDQHGARYLDGVSSLWVTVHGHRHPVLDEAVRRQLGKVAHTTYLGLANEPAAQLARQLVARSPQRLARVFYSDNGSSATEIALKMAYQFSQQAQPDRKHRSQFLSFAHAYHGDTIGAVSMGGIDLFHQVYRPLLFDTMRAPYPYCYRCPLGLEHPACELACFEQVRATVEQHHQTLGAVMIEPLVQGAAGIITAPPGFLKRLETLCRQYDLLLICDEVATGIGRTGRMFACEHEGVEPDLMAIGKGLTGGYLPVAATLVSERVFEAFEGDFAQARTFFHGHTYTANPLGCAAALANLELFDQPHYWEQLQTTCSVFATALQPLRQHPQVGEVRQCGMMVGIELVADKNTRQPFAWGERTGHRVCMAARQHGVIIRPLGDVVVLMPPLSITQPELERLVQAVQHALHDVFDGACQR